MAEILQELIVDCATNTETYIPLSAEQIAEREAQAILAQEAEGARLAAEQAAAANKAAVLAALAAAAGLTIEEVTAAIG